MEREKSLQVMSCATSDRRERERENACAIGIRASFSMDLLLVTKGKVSTCLVHRPGHLSPCNQEQSERNALDPMSPAT